jgi:hypothetical protein
MLPDIQRGLSRAYRHARYKQQPVLKLPEMVQRNIGEESPVFQDFAGR